MAHVAMLWYQIRSSRRNEGKPLLAIISHDVANDLGDPGLPEDKSLAGVRPSIILLQTSEPPRVAGNPIGPYSLRFSGAGESQWGEQYVPSRVMDWFVLSFPPLHWNQDSKGNGPHPHARRLRPCLEPPVPLPQQRRWRTVIWSRVLGLHNGSTNSRISRDLRTMIQERGSLGVPHAVVE